MRRFAGSDFVEAYCKYANDDWIPSQFNKWSALSIVAGALERRVWLKWNNNYSFYPNIYVLLVSMPGDGKSVALNQAVKLLIEANKKNENRLSIMPNQVTEAKFIELMGSARSFVEQIGEKQITRWQSCGYYFASEASNALKNIFGDFIACLTDFYDCPETWARATKKDGNLIKLENVCMNLIAGTTFDYLGKLVNDENIMGGFASRLIYVVNKNKKVAHQAFGSTEEEDNERRVYWEALRDDLVAISKMCGPMVADQEFRKAWEAWFPKFETERRAMESEKSQSILARTNTNVLKVAMLLSAAESDERVLHLRHWERALELVLPIQQETPGVFMQARNSGSNKVSGSPAQVILHVIKSSPGISTSSVKGKLIMSGINPRDIDQLIGGLVSVGKIKLGTSSPDGSAKIELLCNPDDYL